MLCAECKIEKTLDEFPTGTAPHSRGLKRCRSCKNALSRRRIKARWGSTRHYHLQQRYGISAAEIEMLKASQGGLCPICRDRPAVHVDHDHVTKRLRGILCEPCNGFLGAFNDDPHLIHSAIEYLETPR